MLAESTYSLYISVVLGLEKNLKNEKKNVLKNNFRILKKQYAYLQTILKAPVKFKKDWPKTVGGVAGRRMVGALTDGWTDTQNFRGYNNTPPLFWWRGIKILYDILRCHMSYTLELLLLVKVEIWGQLETNLNVKATMSNK